MLGIMKKEIKWIRQRAKVTDVIYIIQTLNQQLAGHLVENKIVI